MCCHSYCGSTDIPRVALGTGHGFRFDFVVVLCFGVFLHSVAFFCFGLAFWTCVGVYFFVMLF